MNLRISSVIAGLALGLSAASPVSAAVYNINFEIVSDIFSSAGLSGTITTNGALGVLSATDIVDYSLVITGNSPALNPGNSILSLSGSGLSATTQQLLFDFSYGFGNASGSFSSSLIVDANTNPNANGHIVFFGQTNFGATSGLAQLLTNNVFAGSPESGNQVIGMAAAVPEPSSWVIMIIGFLGVGFMAYRHKSKPEWTRDPVSSGNGL